MSARADAGTSNRNTAAVFLLLVMMASAYGFRSWFASSVLPPPSRMQGETTQAYRYAAMVSEGGAIPAVDRMVMYPEGLRTSDNSIFEEYVAGWLHRMAGGDFDVFMRFFCIAFPLLSMPGIYLWMRGAGIPGRTALLGAAMYGILLPALLRTRGESLYRETVALPLIVWTGWAADSALGTGKVRYAAAAGLLLFASLAAWKVTGYVSAMAFAFLLLRNCRRGDVPRSLAVSMAAAQLAGSVLLGHMRHDTAILSAASVLALFLLLSIPGSSHRRYLAAAGIVLALASGFLFSGSTGHVGAVMLAKLRFLFSHPADPTLLSPDARLFWVSGYTTPLPGEVLLLFAVPLAVAAFGLRRFGRTSGGTLLYWFLPLSLAGYLFFDRLHVFLALALLPPAALAARRPGAAPVVMLGLALQSAFVTPEASLLGGAGFRFRDGGSLLGDVELDSLLEWIPGGTSSDEAFMSFWHISGLVSAYADRPVVTATFFEDAGNRRNIVEFAGRTFQPEDSLVSFMRRHDADLYVYQADFLLDRSSQGLLYLAGLTEVPHGCAAIRMQYAPETLDSLALVFQGPSLRVYRLGGPAADILPGPLFRLRYYRFLGDYDAARAAMARPGAAARDLAWQGRENGDPDAVSAALALASEAGMDESAATGMLQELVVSYLDGRYAMEYLEEDFLLYLHTYGPDPAVRLDLARLLASEGMTDRAVEQYRIVLQEDPDMADARAELAGLLSGDGNL
jgi:hypothetical protein